MAAEAKNIRNNIGERLRMRRQIKGLSLRDTAQMAAISFGQLSQIERGVSNPSLEALTKVCKALEMPINWLFENNSNTHEDRFIVRKNARRVLQFAELKMDKALLSTDYCTGIQMIEIVIRPGGMLSKEPLSHACAKCATIIDGKLGIEIENNRYELGPGDSFTLSDLVPHRYWCLSDAPVRILFAVSPALY